MRRIAAIFTIVATTAVAGLTTSAGADDVHVYEIEMFNAFGIVTGSDVRIAGVNAGAVTDLSINAAKRALVTVELSGDLGALGEDTKCSSEPQSLIAEYYINCEPAGPALDEDDDASDPDPDITAENVTQTVQTDLVQNTLREPYKRRLQLLINEFGTALAGNPESLNEAIRLGAPALVELQKATEILASQNTIIRDLQADSDQVISALARRREDVVRFVEEAEDTAAASVGRREDLSRNFEILDDFLAELEPTLFELENLADEQTPLLTDLRAAGDGLNRLALNIPGFASASDDSLDSLGEASQVGRTALTRGADEIEQLAAAGKKAPVTAEALADLFRDIDDPRRAVEIDDRAGRDTGRSATTPGSPDTMGYTGLEGLLNYVYYQTGALNQYDQVGHLLHFSLYNVNTGPCGHFSSGHDEETGEPGLPAEGGGTTTDLVKMDNCVGWLGNESSRASTRISISPSTTHRRARPGPHPSAPSRSSARPAIRRAPTHASGDRSVRAGRGSGSSAVVDLVWRTRQCPEGGTRVRQAAMAAPTGPCPTRSLTRSSTCPTSRSRTCRSTSATCAAAAARPAIRRPPKTFSTSSFPTEPTMLTTTTTSHRSSRRSPAREALR